ncbi:hypothetical protein FHS43_003302 [Streptosporangium becharense]|uniref:WD40 repeat domain-containing protein n=1 Tax=Streptosporangium becharense TaxID=1816182 RepID=A0A7W9ID77_9ACTN|nr:hypothetical protein [Streptosporangium becharense]MBB2912022.1 hypothetical protein [Streptosporangium becharense]MBB5818569.1 hypothetical protein [Streptosporangium becharense]
MAVTPGIYRLLAFSVIAVPVAVSAPPAAHAAPVDLALPGTRVTVREDSADPLRVTSYGFGKAAYLRKGAGFTLQSAYQEITTAPKGGKALAVPASYNGGYDSVVLLDPATSRGTRIRTVRKPLVAHYVHWSRNGAKAVLTVERKSGTAWVTSGFVIVDAVAKTAKTVTVANVDPAARFRWSSDGAELVAEYRGGTRFYGPDGEVRRTFAKTGRPGGGEDVFTPSGRGLMTWCPSTYAEHVCVWDRTSGKLAAKVPGIKPKALWGWWDEKHFIAVVRAGDVYRVVLSDLRGTPTRVLAAMSADDWNRRVYLSYTRR